MSATSSSPSPPPDKSRKKRKRADPAASELEINVDLPEPPSKKALRRAKKGKPSAASAPSTSRKHDDISDLLSPPPSPAADDAASAPAPPKRSPHSIWIGNLPFHCTPALLRAFLAKHSGVAPDGMTRVHLPLTPKTLLRGHVLAYRAAAAEVGLDAAEKEPAVQNRGFAYVDFEGAEGVFAALQVSETEFTRGGRKVLVKEGGNFEGRPEKKAEEVAGKEGEAKAERSKRVFVGNLAFDVTRDDLRAHFEQAGVVEDVFMASFEDSGKCKGYAWVRFKDEDEAERAVKGWVWKEDQPEGDEDSGAEGDDAEDGERSKAPKAKKRKWWINKLFGRMLRCEYAEDASTRYKKRFGKGAQSRAADGDGAEPAVDGAVEPKERAFKPRPRGDADQRQELRRKKHHDARSVAPGQALANAPRASGAIVASQGKKVTFD